MKKIENWLLLPLMILFVWSLTAAPNDPYYVTRRISTMQFLIGVLLLLFILYKIIRKRHHSVNKKVAVIHISLSILLIVLILFPFGPKRTGTTADFDFTPPDIAFLYRINKLVVIVFRLTQVIFLIYFVVQLIKKPIVNRQ